MRLLDLIYVVLMHSISNAGRYYKTFSLSYSTYFTSIKHNKTFPIKVHRKMKYVQKLQFPDFSFQVSEQASVLIHRFTKLKSVRLYLEDSSYNISRRRELNLRPLFK